MEPLVILCYIFQYMFCGLSIFQRIIYDMMMSKFEFYAPIYRDNSCQFKSTGSASLNQTKWSYDLDFV